MRNAGLVVAILIAAFVGWWFGLRDDSTPPEPPPLEDEAVSSEEETLESDDGPALEAAGAAAPEPKDDTPAAPAWEPPENSVTLTGRVLDERRRPVADAEITTVLNYVAPAVPAVRSKADGTFEVQGVVRPEAHGAATLRAIKGNRVGTGMIITWSGMKDRAPVSVISMAVGHELTIRVVTATGEPVADAVAVVEGTIGWRSGVVAMGATQADGTCSFGLVPEGAYRLLAGKTGHGRAMLSTAVPAKGGGAIEVRLGAERPVTVVVTDKTTGDPIEGATVQLEEYIASKGGSMGQIMPYLPRLPIEPTDAEGRTALVGIGEADQLQAHVHADGYPGSGNSRTHMAHKIENGEMHVKLEKLRTVRWPLAADDPLRPPDGTVLEMEQPGGAMTQSLPSSLRIEGDEIVGEDCNPGLFHLTAVGPGGVYARLFVNRTLDSVRETKFQASRKVIVIVKDHEGNPAADAYVSVRNQGNATLVEGTPVDAEGRVEFDLRYAHRIDVFVGGMESSYAGTSVGTLDLKEKGGTIEATLPAPGRRVEATIILDGEPKLPATYHLGQGVTRATDIDEDPENGILRFRLPAQMRADGKINLAGTGFLPTLIEIPAGDPEAIAKVTVILERGGSCLLRVKQPEDGNHQSRVVQEGASHRIGLFVPGGGPAVVGEEDGWTLFRYGPFKPGTYRAIDNTSRKKSKTFEIEEGKETVFDFDLSKVTTLHGTVVVPDGFELTQTRVLLEGDDLFEPQFRGPHDGAYVSREGKFQVRIPGDVAVTLRPKHPMLVPAKEGGTVTLKTPKDGVELRLVEGSSAIFKLDPPPETTRRHPQGEVSVLLYEKTPNGEQPTQRLQTKGKDGVYTIGGFQPGTWTIVVDVRKRAPLVLKDVKLVDGQTDLGTLQTSPGATIRIKLLVKEGQDPPRIFASVSAEGGVAYNRYINSRGEAEVLLQGLGKGRFKFRASPMRGMTSGGGGRLEDTIESDGETEIVKEMDLR